LLYANQVKIITNDFENVIINLTSSYDNSNIDFYNKNLSSLIIFNPEEELNSGHFINKIIENTNIKITLVNFKKLQNDKKDILYINTLSDTDNNLTGFNYNNIGREPASLAINKNIIEISNNSEKSPVEIKYSYFPDWHSSEGLKIYQTDLNQIVVYPKKESLSINFKSRYSKAITFMMIMLTAVLIIFFIINTAGKFIKKK